MVPVVSHTEPPAPFTVCHLLLGIGGFSVGLGLGVAALVWAVLVGTIPDLSPASWFGLVWLGSVWYRSFRLVVMLMWGGLHSLPSGLGFRAGLSIAPSLYAPSWNLPIAQGNILSGTFMFWLRLIILVGLVNPSDATPISYTDVSSNGAVEHYGLVVRPQAVCESIPPYNSGIGYGGWRLLSVGCIGVVTIWETCKWAVRRFLLYQKTAESHAQTDDLPIAQNPLPENVEPLSRILFALWRADLDVPTELYPEEVQQEFFGFLGSHLRRLEQGEDSSD